MCLTALPNDRNVYLVTKPIKVWKRGRRESNGLVPPYYGSFKYIFGEMRASRIVHVGGGAIEDGLHAYYIKPKREPFYDDKYFPAIIPKGAWVVLGKRNEIVASHLVVYSDRVGTKIPRAARLKHDYSIERLRRLPNPPSTDTYYRTTAEVAPYVSPVR